MPKQSLTIEVEVPEGWELTGEFRSPESGEVVLKGFLTGNGQAIRVVCSPMARYENCPILRKAEVWKPLTLEKVVEFATSQKHVTVRYCAGKGPRVGSDIPGFSHKEIIWSVDFTNRSMHLSNCCRERFDEMEYLEEVE